MKMREESLEDISILWVSPTHPQWLGKQSQGVSLEVFWNSGSRVPVHARRHGHWQKAAGRGKTAMLHWQGLQCPIPPAVRPECPGISYNELWAKGGDKSAWSYQKSSPKDFWKEQHACSTPRSRGGKMSGQPVPWKVWLNAIWGGPLKTTTEAVLIFCKTQRDGPLSSSKTASKDQSRLCQWWCLPALSLYLLQLHSSQELS